ncbi:MAG: hypothetical protein OXT65_06795, partial [Alphaproteobacteria bacterium]|nr:hypothetical protein [Alphaproteobacteria bacterium]
TSHADGGYIHGIIDRFARLPRLFADMSDERLERGHFGAWWSCVYRRAYDDPVVHDLYLLHEYMHGAEMAHIKGQDMAQFRYRIADNELRASVMSEIIVYFALPELRAVSFDREIYADRFLKDAYFQNMWKHDPMGLVTDIYSRRRQAMFAPQAGDRLEKWISDFTAQNDAWFDVWAERYDMVETRMEDFSQTAFSKSRVDALAWHLDWLRGEAARDPSGVPFAPEAKAFADIYWRGREDATPRRQHAA